MPIKALPIHYLDAENRRNRLEIKEQHKRLIVSELSKTLQTARRKRDFMADAGTAGNRHGT